MKCVLAVSGGVDSMVLLDIIWNHLDAAHTIVATFDHGTRPSAKDDVAFVEKIIKRRYSGVLCFCGEDNLGENASEALARERRYNFLNSILNKTTVQSTDSLGSVFIYTAHHLDDLVESVAVNLLRGTGWRGLAVLDSPKIKRPFLEPENMPEPMRSLVPFDKKKIQNYASKFKIIYRQDPTNNEETYLRNRLRKTLLSFEYKEEIYRLWQTQKRLKREIDEIITAILPAEGGFWQRSWFETLDQRVALELLRAGTLRVGISATRPQLENFRRAILTYAPGKKFNLPGDKFVKMERDGFVL